MADGPCVFCQIVAGELPATVVAEWSDALAIVPLGPVVDGHTLIIPKVHVADAVELPSITANTMARAAEFGERFESSNILTSNGGAATQSIFHLHIHVVPRMLGDQLMVPWGTLHGENPQHPHRCKGIVALESELTQLRAGTPENTPLRITGDPTKALKSIAKVQAAIDEAIERQRRQRANRTPPEDEPPADPQ